MQLVKSMQCACQLVRILQPRSLEVILQHNYTPSVKMLAYAIQQNNS